MLKTPFVVHQTAMGHQMVTAQLVTRHICLLLPAGICRQSGYTHASVATHGVLVSSSSMSKSAFNLQQDKAAASASY